MHTRVCTRPQARYLSIADILTHTDAMKRIEPVYNISETRVENQIDILYRDMRSIPKKLSTTAKAIPLNSRQKPSPWLLMRGRSVLEWLHFFNHLSSRRAFLPFVLL